MSLEILEGPMTSAPPWSGGSATFVRTSVGFRQLYEPRGSASLRDQVATWGQEWFFGGTPQYWRVITAPLAHPETVCFPVCKEGGQQFEIGLTYNVQVVDPQAAIKAGLKSLQDYFKISLERHILPMARAHSIADSVGLQAVVERNLGLRFGDDVVKASDLVVRVMPRDPAMRGTMGKVGGVVIIKKGIDADAEVQQHQIATFKRVAGHMTIQELAMAAIGSGDQRLLTAYNQMVAQQHDAGKANWEKLKFLVENKLIEPHQLEQHLGPLSGELMKNLVAVATTSPQLTAQQKPVALPKP